jgi:hypothetical protein
LKGKNMKKNLTVLVLLVTWVLLSSLSLSSSALAGDGPEINGPLQGPDPEEVIVPVNGAVDDDDDEGDPGDAGDGYGATLGDGSDALGGYDIADKSILDELMLILMSLVQLAF